MLHRLSFQVIFALIAITAWADNVATVKTTGGTKDYETFGEALDAANATANAQIILCDDAFITETANVSSTMTLDLNGWMLAGECNTLLNVEGNNTSLTIKDSSTSGQGIIIHEPNEDAITMTVKKGAHVTFENGALEAVHYYAGEQSLYGINVTNGGSFTMLGGYISIETNVKAYGVMLDSNTTMDMKGGSISANAKTLNTKTQSYAVGIIGGTLNVSDGSLSAKAQEFANCLYLATNTSCLNISGGHFLTTNTRPSYNDIKILSTPKVAISGGVFSHEQNLLPYLTEGRHVVPLSESSKDYADGYGYKIADAPYTTAIARNLTSGKDFDTLEEALATAVAKDTISLTNDYTLNNDVTVKKDVVLLIPFDSNNTCFTGKPEAAYPHVEEYIYRTLTVGKGVKIDVKGEMSVSAMLTSVSGHQAHGTGAPYGGHAVVVLDEGAEITVDGSLYCWGYIGGKGTVKMNSTSTLHETLQIVDWRGGNISVELEAKMYPFYQYYVQNVEVPVTFQYGARDMLATDISFEHENHTTYDMAFITPDTAGLYKMHEGAVITRRYIADKDRMEYMMNGNVTLGGIAVDYNGMKMDSRYYTFPIVNNTSMTISNGTLTMPHDYALTAGVEIEVAEDALLDIGKEASIYAYDHDDWRIFGIKGYVYPLEYTFANGHNNRAVRWTTVTKGDDEASYKKVSDAKIDVKGTMKIRGRVMTTQAGADINSSTDGVIIFCNGTETTTGETYLCEGGVSDIATIAVTSLPKTAGIELGDADMDGRISMADANIIVNTYLGGDSKSMNIHIADMDEDGRITMADANRIVNNYLGEKQQTFIKKDD